MLETANDYHKLDDHGTKVTQFRRVAQTEHAWKKGNRSRGGLRNLFSQIPLNHDVTITKIVNEM
eukprot:344875-Amphidinium_carterae.1